MIYISGYEAETKYDREIVIAENINQKIIFKENIKKTRFLYPHSDLEKDVVVHVNVIEKALYKINIFVNGNNIKEEKISNTQIFYLNSEIITDIFYQNSICPIIVEIIYDQQIITEDPMQEITVRSIGGAPTYLQKGKTKLDFASDNNIYYLYTDIGKNEFAEVTVNFLRQPTIRVLGKIVSKYQSFQDEETNWRGRYRLPSYDWDDSYNIDEYTKKLHFTNEHTQDCINGCYLLISIELINSDYYGFDLFYPFSIITKITPSNMAYTDRSKIIIQVDEIILGNVGISTDERISEFFEIWLPLDSDTVEFDWQSSVAGLYINVGGNRPTTRNADFKLLPPGRDTILSLTKEAILNVVEAKKIYIPNKNSLEDLNLVIGIWTNKTDSIDNEFYSFRVNQKIMCNPEKIDSDKYRCLFVVTYSDKDIEQNTPLFIYGTSMNQEALHDMFASFIDKDIYDQYIEDDLKSRMSTEQNSDFETKISSAQYFYIKSLEKGKYNKSKQRTFFLKERNKFRKGSQFEKNINKIITEKKDI